jgi:hypothetical protein
MGHFFHFKILRKLDIVFQFELFNKEPHGFQLMVEFSLKCCSLSCTSCATGLVRRDGTTACATFILEPHVDLDHIGGLVRTTSMFRLQSAWKHIRCSYQTPLCLAKGMHIEHSFGRVTLPIQLLGSAINKVGVRMELTAGGGFAQLVILNHRG